MAGTVTRRDAGTEAVDLSVVVVSYNTSRLLDRCLRSILRQSSLHTEVFVVDNASGDGSAAMVKERFPIIHLIANGQNRGFGAANNQAIALASGRSIVLVNPDCEVRPGSLPALQRFLDEHPQAAVAGGRLLYEDGSFQHNAFRFPGLAQVFLDYFPLHWRLVESRWNGRFPRAWDDRAYQMDHPLGAFFAVRRDAVEQVGAFDEGYFMYAEEVDWCYRLKQAGWEVWHCPEAVAVHLGGRSTRQHAPEMYVELHRSRWRFYRKYYPRWFRLAVRPIIWTGMVRKLVSLWRPFSVGGSDRAAQSRAFLEIMRL